MTVRVPPNNPFMAFESISAVDGASIGFMPSAVSVREQRTREQADRTIKQFIERFTGKDFFPQDSEALVFALLPQLPEWPLDLQLKVLNEHGDAIATYLKGNDASVIQDTISLVQDSNGEYTAQSVNDHEALFQLIFDQLPVGSRLGFGGNFPGSSSTAGRVVTLREQLVELLRSERAKVFEALLADDTRIKYDPDISLPNPFLPLWKQPPTDRSPVLGMLLALNPEMPVRRLGVLLEQSPLSEAQQDEFLAGGALPERFVEALSQLTGEWRRDRGLDGVFHTRTYNIDADALAREFSQILLNEHFGYELSIIESGKGSDEPGSPNAHIVLLHDGDGNYAVKNLRDDEINSFSMGTDSFYRAIGSVLQPHERLRLGMQSETDIAGLRTAVGNTAATANGGWFDPQNHIQAKDDLLPEWMRDAPAADKGLWNDALQDYRQALVEAQVPGLPDLSQYGNAEQLRSYAKTQLEQRLGIDFGVQLDAETIFIETTESQWRGNWEGPPGPVFGGDGRQSPGEAFDYITTRRSLVELCLENLRVEDLDFWLTARVLDSNGLPIKALSKNYVHGLVRELNVGDSYVTFLGHRLLTSSFGQWSQERYAQVMGAQMRLDVIEAKMAKDFLGDDSLPPERADRGYKWVKAVLDHPIDDGGRARVEGHRIQVQELRLKYVSLEDPRHHVILSARLSQLDGISLEGLLMIAPESRLSVPGAVIYTPSAPDGIRFREFSSEDEMEREMLSNPDLREYLVSRVPGDRQAYMQEALSHDTNRAFLKIDAQPALTDSLYLASYKTEVQRVMALVDIHATSTSEANWQSAWNISSTLAEIALEFTPFKVRLPIAAARSLYALSQGVGAISDGNGSAIVHFAQAGLLLTDGLPGVRKAKVKNSSVLNLDPKKALLTSPKGLKLRTDGIYNGVYEKPKVTGPSDFYAQEAGKTFPIRYDAQDATWRLIDLRRPDAYYRMPIRFDGQGRWTHSPVGPRGGAKKKGASGDQASDKPTEPTLANSLSNVKKLFTLDMDGFFESKAFKKAQKSVQDDLVPAIEKAVSRYRFEGKGALHPSEAGLYSLDLPGIGRSTGRGAWRLMFEPPAKGVLKVHSVRNPH